MTQDLTFELDHGLRFGGRLILAVAILVAPIAAKAAMVAGMLDPAGGLGTTAYWLWVLVGGPLAFVLAQADVYAVRRVRLVVSPERDRWELDRASLGNASRASGSLQDVLRADYEERRPHHVAVRLVGKDGEVLGEVLAFEDQIRATPFARVGFGDGALRPFRPGESLCDVAMVLHGRLLDVLDARPGAVVQRA